MVIKPQIKTVEVIDHSATGATARKARKKTGASLRSVARAIGCSAAFISDLELGRRNWTPKMLHAYSNALTRNHTK